MDTSNSTSFDLARFVLKGHALSIEDLSPEDWMWILEDVVTRLKPILQYMEGFGDVEVPYDIWRNHHWLYKKVTFVESPTFKRKLRHLTDITFTVPASPTPFLWQSVLIDRNGDWIQAGYMRNSREPKAFWMYPNHAEMLAILGDAHSAPGRIGYVILEGLADMVRKTVEERQHRLETIRERESWLNGVLGRLDH